MATSLADIFCVAWEEVSIPETYTFEKDMFVENASKGMKAYGEI